MAATTFVEMVKRLPPSPAREQQERLARMLGDAWIVRTSYSDAPLWLVPGKPQARELRKRGIPRCQIWTLAELQNLLDACGTPVRTLAEAAEVLGSEPPPEHIAIRVGED